MYLKQERNSDFDMILFAELCLSKKRVFATLLAPSWALSGEMHQGELVRSIRMGFQSAEIEISIKSRQKINMHTKNKNKFQPFNFEIFKNVLCCLPYLLSSYLKYKVQPNFHLSTLVSENFFNSRCLFLRFDDKYEIFCTPC